MIGYSLTAGWTPETLGGTYQLTSATDLKLPGFAITDLLWVAEQHDRT
jgi:hypothetical protein